MIFSRALPHNQQLKLIALSSPTPQKVKCLTTGELWNESIFLCNILAGLSVFTLPQHTFPSFLQNSCSVNPLLSQAMKISSQTYKSINKPEKGGEREKAGKENEKDLPNKLPGLDFKIKEDVLLFFKGAWGGGGIFSTPQNRCILSLPFTLTLLNPALHQSIIFTKIYENVCK